MPWAQAAADMLVHCCQECSGHWQMQRCEPHTYQHSTLPLIPLLFPLPPPSSYQPQLRTAAIATLNAWHDQIKLPPLVEAEIISTALATENPNLRSEVLHYTHVCSLRLWGLHVDQFYMWNYTACVCVCTHACARVVYMCMRVYTHTC